MKNPKSAVILCAGRGTRLGELTREKPKCLLEINGKSILERAISQFKQIKVEQIICVVGYKKDLVIEAGKQITNNFIALYNPDFATTNTLVSLWYAKNYLLNGFWLLNGDVILDSNSFSRFKGGISEIGVSPHKCAEEEVKVKIDDKNRVIALSKNIYPGDAIGEFIGLAYFNANFSKILIKSLDEWKKNKDVNKQYFEAAVENVILEEPLYVANLDGINCIEVDTPEDYGQAKKIWSKLE